MKKSYKTPLALAMGASLLPFITVAQADSNPFTLSELKSGYQLAQATPAQPDSSAKSKEAACGEGKCGAGMKHDKTADKKAVEAKCAGNKPATPADSKGNGH